MTTLYVSDLDGTLLRNDATLSQYSLTKLQQLIMDGLHFSVARARSVVSMQTILAGLDLRLPIIEFNGAFISDLHSGRHHIVNAIQSDIAESIFGDIEQKCQTPFISTFDGVEDHLYYSESSNAGEHWYVKNRIEHGDSRLCLTNNLINSFKEQIVCLTVIGGNEALSELELELRESYGIFVEIHHFENAYSPGWHWLTIHDKRATKDQAIRTMMDAYNLIDHELIVFGDQANDIKMFQDASHAIAVSNADDEVKSHATRVIGSNEEDSVVKFIENHFSRSE